MTTCAGIDLPAMLQQATLMPTRCRFSAIALSLYDSICTLPCASHIAASPLVKNRDLQAEQQQPATCQAGQPVTEGALLRRSASACCNTEEDDVDERNESCIQLSFSSRPHTCASAKHGPCAQPRQWLGGAPPLYIPGGGPG